MLAARLEPGKGGGMARGEARRRARRGGGWWPGWPPLRAGRRRIAACVPPDEGYPARLQGYRRAPAVAAATGQAWSLAAAVLVGMVVLQRGRMWSRRLMRQCRRGGI